MAASVGGRILGSSRLGSLGGRIITPGELPPGTGGGGGNLDDPLEGDLTGLLPNAFLRNIQAGATVAFPSSLSVNAKGQVTAQAAGVEPIPLSQKGAADGVASLDSAGRLLPTELPISALSFQGVWDAATNTPTLASGVGTSGQVYIVDVAGTTDLDGENVWAEGDWAVFTPQNVWQRVERETSGVTSVNGVSGPGAIVLALTNANFAPILLAQLNALISDANLDAAATPRPPTGTPTGDLGGTFQGTLTVTGLQNRGVATTAPNTGQILAWNGTLWAPADQATALAPELLDFHTTVPGRVDLATNVQGTYTSTYRLVRAASIATLRIIGRGQGEPSDTVLVASSSKNEGSNEQGFTLPSFTLTNAGDAYTITIEGYTVGQTVGVDTPAVSDTSVITAQATTLAGPLYFGTAATDVPASINLATLSSQSNLSGSLVVPTFSGSAFLVFAFPDTAERLTAIQIGGINQIGVFNETEDAQTHSSVNYDIWISQNQLLGSVISGETVTLVRG